MSNDVAKAYVMLAVVLYPCSAATRQIVKHAASIIIEKIKTLSLKFLFVVRHM